MKGQSDNKDLQKKFKHFSYPVGDANWDAIAARLPEGKPAGALAEKFANFKAEPSSKVWSNISATIQPSRSKRPVVWWRYAAAASLLLFVYVGYVVFDSAEGPKQLVQEKAAKTQQTKEEKLSEKGIAPLDQDSSNSGAAASGAYREMPSFKSDTKVNRASGKADEITSESGTLAKSTRTTHAAINPPEGIHAEEIRGGIDKNEGTVSYPAGSIVEERAPITLLAKAALRDAEIEGYRWMPNFAEFSTIPVMAQALPTEKNKKSSAFYDGTETESSQNFSLWAGSLLAFGNSASQNNMELVNSNFNNGVGTGSGEITADLSMNSIVKKYATPIYYGVNGEIKIWNRLAAGIGVGFLQMRTTAIQTYWNGDEVVQKSEHRFLSLPVYAKFNFIDKSKFAAYTSLGHGYDILLGQKISTESSSNAQLIASGNLPHEDQGNQANLYAGLGMHFKFSRQFGVFAEGSLMHYYQLSNNNFFGQQKYWPGLRFGLLMTFD